MSGTSYPEESRLLCLEHAQAALRRGMYETVPTCHIDIPAMEVSTLEVNPPVPIKSSSEQCQCMTASSWVMQAGLPSQAIPEFLMHRDCES